MTIGKRTTSIIILSVVMFTIGYYNEPISILFLNKDSLIGLLCVVVFGYMVCAQILYYKNLRLRHRNEMIQNDLDNQINKYYNLKHTSKKPIRAYIESRFDKQDQLLNKSISLRDDINQQLKNEIDELNKIIVSYKMKDTQNKNVD